jgi:hypothetical protein
MTSSDVTVTDEWVLGSGHTPFFTKRVSRLRRRPALRLHGFAADFAVVSQQ